MGLRGERSPGNGGDGESDCCCPLSPWLNWFVRSFGRARLSARSVARTGVRDVMSLTYSTKNSTAAAPRFFDNLGHQERRNTKTKKGNNEKIIFLF